MVQRKNIIMVFFKGCVHLCIAILFSVRWMICCSAGQCPVSVPTIVSSSSSDDICQVVSKETLTYTCNNDGASIVWTSSVFDGNYAVVVGVPVSIPSSTVSGVTFTENNNNDATCLNSTLTFSGNLTLLTALNGITLSCTTSGQTPSSVTIMIPSKQATCV